MLLLRRDDMHGMDVFVARQPIFDRQRRLHAYELLFRQDAIRNEFDGTEAGAATNQVIANTLFAIGLEDMLCGKKAFINLGRNLLVDGLHSILPKEIAIIEVLESVKPDPEVLEACRKLRREGYLIALDDFVDHPRMEPFTHIANLIKVDMRKTRKEEQERLIRTYKHRGIEMLAEKVETYEEFRWAQAAGYDYFQGYFFARPVVIRGRQIPSSTVVCLRLLQETQRADLDFECLEELIAKDVSLSYKLLRYANSALIKGSSQISSIREAVIRIGEASMRRWIIFAALSRMAVDKPGELATLSIVRAHFCQSIAQLAGVAGDEGAFLMGLFSLLDALIDRPLDQALSQVKLSPAITEALLGKSADTDRFTLVYKVARGYEAGDWDAVKALSMQLNLPAAAIGDAYRDSMRRSSELLRENI